MYDFYCLAIAHFLSVMSPGIAFIAVIKNSLAFGYKKTTHVVIGIAAGHGILVIIVMLGVSGILLHDTYITIAFRLAGAAYLLFLAVKIITTKSFFVNSSSEEISKIFINGFIIALSNPKYIVFYTSILGVFIKKHTTHTAQIGWLMWMTLSSFIYLMLLSFLISKFKQKILNYLMYFEKAFALALIALSSRIVIDAIKYSAS